MSSVTRTVVADLGWCLAKITVTNGITESLIIISPADTSENRYAPCESVCVYGRSNMVKLQTFLNENMNAKESD